MRLQERYGPWALLVGGSEGIGEHLARKLGAEGIVPSVGNLIPEACRGLCALAWQGDWAAAENHAARMSTVAALYQNGRTLGQSLAALKGALYCLDLCSPHVLPPLTPLSPAELEEMRAGMSGFALLK